MSQFPTYKLEEVCDIQIGKTPRREIATYWGKGYTWVSISDMKSSEVANTKEEITELAVEECGCKLIRKGTILLSFKLSIGKVAFAGKDLFTNEAIAALPVKKKDLLHPNYLYYVLKTIPLTGSNNAAMGATLNKASLSNLKIPIPKTISDQIRIAEILSKAESLISQRKESLRLLDELVKSTFLEMFDRKSGLKMELSELVDIQSGQVDPTADPFRNMLHVGGANIEGGSGKLLNLKKAYQENLISGKYLFDKNTVLYSKIRPYLNKVAVPDFDGLCSADIYPITPKQKLINKQFLRYTLMSEDFLSYAAKHSDRTSIPKVNRDSLLKYVLPLPSIQLQTKFAHTVENTELLKGHYLASLQELENLYGSLSQRAFRGELT